jgi:uncharacterized protein YndB with AHSA1/START domain
MATYCPPIVHSAYLNVPRERVYAALTTSSGWDAWFTRGAQVDPTQGGRIILRWRNFGPDHMTVEDSGVVTEVVPGQRFAFQWRVGDSATTVAFDITERGGGTVVRVSETGYTQSDGDLKALIGCATGWAEALTLLKFYLEHGVVYGEVPREAISVVSRPAPSQANPYTARPTVQNEPEAVPATSGSLLDAEA